MVTDETIAGLVFGDRESWETFVETTGALMTAMAYRTLVRYRGHARTGDVEEVIQNVYLKLLQNDRALLRRYDPGRASLTTWIGLITRSVAIDYLRRQKNTLPLNEETAVDADALEHSPDTATIDLPRGLLSGRQALVLRLLFDREMEPAEVAEFLGVDVQTVRSTKHKAIAKLRRYYKETS